MLHPTIKSEYEEHRFCIQFEKVFKLYIKPMFLKSEYEEHRFYIQFEKVVYKTYVLHIHFLRT